MAVSRRGERMSEHPIKSLLFWVVGRWAAAAAPPKLGSRLPDPHSHSLFPRTPFLSPSAHGTFWCGRCGALGTIIISFSRHRFELIAFLNSFLLGAALHPVPPPLASGYTLVADGLIPFQAVGANQQQEWPGSRCYGYDDIGRPIGHPEDSYRRGSSSSRLCLL